jgi:hypothetical protein
LKKAFALSLILLSMISCKEEEIQSFNDLDAAEQAAIQSMGQTQCHSKVASTYNQFKTSSNAIFTSGSYNREDGFEYVLKSGTTTERTIQIKVWKQTASEIFFYISDDKASGDYFLRWQKTDNEQMITDLKDAQCLRPAIYTSTLSGSSLTMKYEYTLSKAPDHEDYVDTYTMPFSQPAFFANYKIGRVKKLVNDSDVVQTTTTYTSTLTAKTYDFGNNDNPEDNTQYNQLFCVVTRGGSGYRFANQRGVEGFLINLSDTTPVTGTCQTSKPAAWDMSI